MRTDLAATLLGASLVGMAAAGGIAVSAAGTAAHHAGAPAAAAAPAVPAPDATHVVSHPGLRSEPVASPSRTRQVRTTPSTAPAASPRPRSMPSHAPTTKPDCPTNRGAISGDWCSHSANGPDNPGYVPRTGPVVATPPGYHACGQKGAICPDD